MLTMTRSVCCVSLFLQYILLSILYKFSATNLINMRNVRLKIAYHAIGHPGFKYFENIMENGAFTNMYANSADLDQTPQKKSALFAYIMFY